MIALRPEDVRLSNPRGHFDARRKAWGDEVLPHRTKILGEEYDFVRFAGDFDFLGAPMVNPDGIDRQALEALFTKFQCSHLFPQYSRTSLCHDTCLPRTRSPRIHRMAAGE